MKQRLSEKSLGQCGEFISRRFGLHFPKKRWRDLERGIIGAAGDLGLDEVEPYVKRLIAAQLTKDETSALLCRLTIGETYFFRENNCFEALRTQILPPLITSRRLGEKRLRIWCAGCSTGEEPYSVAMLLHGMIADLAQWNLTILATDINPASLRKGAKGEYGDWSFRDTPAWVRERYFKANNEGRLVRSAAIRKMVTFAPLNLCQDPYPALANNTNAMDIIFCRNVMMYFAPERVREVIAGLRRCLVAGGWLIVSPCETSHTLFDGFAPVRLGGSLFYRRDEEKSPLSPLPQWESAAPLSPATGTVTAKGADTQNLTFPSPPLSQSGDTTATGHGEEEPAAPAGDPLLMAHSFANRGDLRTALEWSEKAIAADRLNPMGHYLQATIFQERGDDEAAAVSLKRAIYLDQGFVIAHFALANLALRRGRKKEAARHLANAASLLQAFGNDDILPGSEGMSARRLAEIIAAMRGQ